MQFRTTRLFRPLAGHVHNDEPFTSKHQNLKVQAFLSEADGKVSSNEILPMKPARFLNAFLNANTLLFVIETSF